MWTRDWIHPHVTAQHVIPSPCALTARVFPPDVQTECGSNRESIGEGDQVWLTVHVPAQWTWHPWPPCRSDRSYGCWAFCHFIWRELVWGEKKLQMVPDTWVTWCFLPLVFRGGITFNATGTDGFSRAADSHALGLRRTRFPGFQVCCHVTRHRTLAQGRLLLFSSPTVDGSDERRCSCKLAAEEEIHSVIYDLLYFICAR